jgi:hypothetical protein
MTKKRKTRRMKTMRMKGKNKIINLLKVRLSQRVKSRTVVNLREGVAVIAIVMIAIRNLAHRVMIFLITRIYRQRRHHQY